MSQATLGKRLAWGETKYIRLKYFTIKIERVRRVKNVVRENKNSEID